MVPRFVGRGEALAILDAALTAVASGPAGLPRRPGLVLVSGEAGIGKTALLTRFAADLPGPAYWGTCWDAGQAPAFWPWTRALSALWEARADLRVDLPPELGVIVPELAGRPDLPGDARPRVFDAVGRLLGRAARSGHPTVVVLDDLHWADQSTLDLLRYLTRTPLPGPVLLVGAYRPEEPPGLAGLATVADSVPLSGLAAAEVADLVADIAGAEAAATWTADVYLRTGGHPFLARELSYLIATGRTGAGVPAAAREVIHGRLARVTAPCARMLDAASVVGTQLSANVLGEATGDDPVRVVELLDEAVAVGIITAEPGAAFRFTHDLYRETIYASLPATQRLELHRRIGTALAARAGQAGTGSAAEIARHFTAAAAVVDPATVVESARTAARAETARFAHAEAAAHLGRARTAITAAGGRLADAELVDLLTAEADAHLRAGDAGAARDRLDLAWVRATDAGADTGTDAGEADLIAVVALGLDRLGARFAMPRTELIAALDRARTALAGTDSTVEACVTAALARQLQHSVPRDRPRAGPLAEQAVAIARRHDDPATLAECLLAQHDAVWTAGTAAQRAGIADEIARLAERAGDPERRTQALLLTATARLELGDPAFRAPLAEYIHETQRLRQPRHDYLVRTRTAALALLDGDLDAAGDLIEDAYALGEQVGDRDAGNVRMSQRLELDPRRGGRGAAAGHGR